MPSKHIITKKELPKLEELIRSKHTVLLLHAKWCIHCKMFAAEWSKFVSSMKNEQVQTLSIESEVIQDLMKENEKLLNYISKTPSQPDLYFPKIMVFVKGEKGIRKYAFTDERTAETLKSFVKSKIPKK